MISSFKKQGALWNPHLTDYHNRQIKEEAWMVIAAETGIEIATCKRKIKSLMSSGRREKARIINSRRSGNPDDFVEPTWRYWNALKFLRGLEDDEDDPLGTAPDMVRIQFYICFVFNSKCTFPGYHGPNFGREFGEGESQTFEIGRNVCGRIGRK